MVDAAVRPKKKKTKSQNEERKFASKYGYFTSNGREYVITRPDTPRPWVNVICNGEYGMIESQTGSGFSWFHNSNLSRITRWEQDLIKDSWGKYIYVRDRENKKFWSATWKPCCPKFDFFEARHGQGYSILKSVYQGIEITKTVFVDSLETAEVWHLKVKNIERKKRKLSLFSYFEWCLGNAADTHREFQKTFIETRIDRKNHCLWGRKRPALVPGFISTGLSESPLEAFHACNIKPVAYEGDKEAFFGRYGEIQSPKAVRDGHLQDTDGKWVDSIASLQVDLDLAPGETKDVVFILGATKTREHCENIIQKYKNAASVNRELLKVKKFWDSLVNATTIETPDEAMDIMTNIWLKYQAISARLWARCAYYQSSGGFGFRDQLQDSQIFFSLKPELAKRQILLHSEQQFPDGTVHHWWHHGTSVGAVTHMTDDLLWLVFLTLNYLDETADETLLEERTKFLPDPKTKEITEGAIYDHCVRAIRKVLSRWSERGLPLIGEGDWNDGMSHVGLKWKGESIWLGHFLYGILKRFAPIAEQRGEKNLSDEFLQRAEALKDAINKYGWDGEWYLRATRDDGRPLGSQVCDEGKIFLNAQTWAVIHGTATPDRAKKAMESVAKYLYREYGPLLFTPAFSVTDPTIGYLSRYAPSVRENGGLYTHAGTWAIQAECIMRDAQKAYSAYKSFNPILRGLDPDLYYCEPYVTPGNVDGPDSPNFGRGGWTWYTGSGTWYYVIVINWLLGIRPIREGLLIDPVIPQDWPGFRIKRYFRGSLYEIDVKNPNKSGQGVREIRVDQKKQYSNVVPAFHDGKTHKVWVILK
ncbi:MAG: glycosyl transferase family 36 [Candidatus Omnitrophica bacterium]|nr:glycosyl transferase family 36 [Candidatus Omnitrophota bacterium]